MFMLVYQSHVQLYCMKGIFVQYRVVARQCNGMIIYHMFHNIQVSCINTRIYCHINKMKHRYSEDS